MTNLVAKTILEQLGGRRFVLLTGSKNFIAYLDGLRFSLARNASQANRCEITLAPSDTYKVTFSRVSIKRADVSVKSIASFEDVYWDQLQEIFTSVTGLYTSFSSAK